ncbi:MULTISPECIES: hypothetical protein [Ensifer]|uniref:hypothetical protein n=1 Tax=Ensifer TaxID=106591 RepID=UPI000B03BA95|nr:MULTISPECIES: hypothetical protein [Ensifer]MBD9489898.1 hypothetical protein [Ensifer sp. ENS11]
MTQSASELSSAFLVKFEKALAELPEGYVHGIFQGRRWRRVWLYGEELGGADVVSFNLYVLSDARTILRPCEMSSSKVVDFVLGFERT